MFKKNKKYILIIGFIGLALCSFGQNKGSLFIIGGGERSALMGDLVATAQLKPNDYIVVLTMATSVPEESVALLSKQFGALCTNKVAGFHFTKSQANDYQVWIDSVQNARLIYVTGGDQNKFMEVVKDSKLYKAMHDAFANGTTIAGTSAGAAIMSEIMITGAQKDKSATDNFKEIKLDNVETAQGMGFLTTAIIDQHFIIRSRYNRFLSVLGDHPDKALIGIDESTAIVVKGKSVSVVGQSQVVVVVNPKKIKKFNNKKLTFKNANLSLYSSGEQFTIK